MKKVYLALLMAACLGVVSCDKDEPEAKPLGNDVDEVVSANPLVGRWHRDAYDYEGNAYAVYWTFSANGTMVISDKLDVVNGEEITYSYNASTKKLTLAFVVHQLYWDSPAQFYYITSGPKKIFKKVGS